VGKIANDAAYGECHRLRSAVSPRVRRCLRPISGFGSNLPNIWAELGIEPDRLEFKDMIWVIGAWVNVG